MYASNIWHSGLLILVQIWDNSWDPTFCDGLKLAVKLLKNIILKFPKCLAHVFCRWLVLDTDTRDLVSVHTDGNEIISNVKYSPGNRHVRCAHHPHSAIKHWTVMHQFSVNCTVDSELPVSADGNFLAVASHDNFVYIYAVTENGRKYSRVGKCTVSTNITLLWKL